MHFILVLLVGLFMFACTADEESTPVSSEDVAEGDAGVAGDTSADMGEDLVTDMPGDLPADVAEETGSDLAADSAPEVSVDLQEDVDGSEMGADLVEDGADMESDAVIADAAVDMGDDLPEDLALDLSPPDYEPIAISPSDEMIQYTGRWLTTNPERPTCAWQGSSIIANFHGTGISATFDTGSYVEYFRVIIDGDAANSVKYGFNPERTTYVLAADLPDGEHSIEIVKETYEWSPVTFFGFELLGTGLLPPPERPPRRIEFYGDSNLAGYSLSNEQNDAGSEFIGSYYGLAGITARMFNAEYHNISGSGETISGLHSVYDNVDWFTSTPSWDFDLFPADVVVINLGANDVGWSSVSGIKADYHDLLDDLRGHHPTAHIVLFNGWGWDYDEPANYTFEVVEERDDDNLSVMIFPWVFEQWHGCEYDHSGMAHVLVEHLAPIMDWDYQPADVMTGYGVNGDVANGSFEEIAPFGGYGWRYFEDTGVSRVHDPEGAYDGEYYLQLRNRAETHQPNPAVPGDVVTVNAWIRGEESGNTVDITLDFRDQEMWTTELQTETESFELTTEWAQYTMTATAPTGGARPVFHTRVTFQASSGETIHIDDVTMTTE